MLKAVCLTIIVVGVAIRVAEAAEAARTDDDPKELECRDELERELQGYVKLDGWQRLFTRHLKFIVNENGHVLSARKRLKFNTVMHNAIYGCDHDRDDEVDDCPNIRRGSVRSCKHGLNLRAAMFRSARCVFVESSVKHLVLSDALLDAYPFDKLDKISTDADKPIREFGKVVVDMLSALGHGEVGGLGELMALNLYLNNVYGTVFLYKVPVEPLTSRIDMETAREHMRHVHLAIVDKLHTFWNTWCSDRDIVTQYRVRYKNVEFSVVLDAMNGNTDKANGFIRDLNVSGRFTGLDFDPKRIALTDFVAGLVSNKTMPDPVLLDLQLKSFRATFDFGPRAMGRYHDDVFRYVYACAYWTTVAHLRLAVQFANEIEKYKVDYYGGKFLVNFVKFVRPLAVFAVNRQRFPAALPSAASDNLAGLLEFLRRFHEDSKRGDLNRLILGSRPEMRKFDRLLSADLVTVTDGPAPAGFYFENISYESTLKLMRTNCRAFGRLALATGGFERDLNNVRKLKSFTYFLSEAVDFAGQH